MQYLAFQYGMRNGLVQPIANNEAEVVFIYGNIFSYKDKFLSILENKVKLFCINIDIPSQTKYTKEFLNIMFPNKSFFELDNVIMSKISKLDESYMIKAINNNFNDN